MTNSHTPENNDPKQVLDKRVLEMLICPQSGSPLSYDAATNELVSRKAKLAYPIREGVPILLVEEARNLDG